MKLKYVLLIPLLLTPLLSQASFQLAGSSNNYGRRLIKDYPLKYSINPNYTMFINRGSLYSNILSYCNKTCWTLKWHTNKKDKVIVKSQMIVGYSFKQVLGTLLYNYPNLKAHYNFKKHIVGIYRN